MIRKLNGLVFLAGALCLFAWGVQAAEQLRLAKPIDCQLGNDCWLVNLVDQDTGPEFQDFMCASHGYDGHKGVDFAIRDLAAMDAGVPVLAAASGIVKGVRNHMDDINSKKLKEGLIEGLDCGNGLVIQHADDWETQYCHMRRGSVRVTTGQQVETGEVLGFVGNSGRAEFPHLHLSVRHGGGVVDPFSGEIISADGPTCGVQDYSASLWNDPSVTQATETMTALFDLGFAPRAMNRDLARTGQFQASTLPATSPLMVLWAHMFWIAGQDRFDLKVVGPGGSTLAEKTIISPRRQAGRLVWIGKKNSAGKWPAGTYVGEIRLTRTREDGTVMEILRTTSVVVQQAE